MENIGGFRDLLSGMRFEEHIAGFLKRAAGALQCFAAVSFNVDLQEIDLCKIVLAEPGVERSRADGSVLFAVRRADTVLSEERIIEADFDRIAIVGRQGAGDGHIPVFPNVDPTLGERVSLLHHVESEDPGLVVEVMPPSDGDADVHAAIDDHGVAGPLQVVLDTLMSEFAFPEIVVDVENFIDGRDGSENRKTHAERDCSYRPKK